MPPPDANERCRDALRQAFVQRPDVATDPALCRALLNDVLAESSVDLRDEVQALVDAVTAGAPTRLRAGDAIGGVAAQVSETTGGSPDMSEWAVTTWSDVLEPVTEVPPAEPTVVETGAETAVVPTAAASGSEPWDAGDPDATSADAGPGAVGPEASGGDEEPPHEPGDLSGPSPGAAGGAADTPAGRRRGKIVALAVAIAVLLIGGGTAAAVIAGGGSSHKAGPTTTTVNGGGEVTSTTSVATSTTAGGPSTTEGPPDTSIFSATTTTTGSVIVINPPGATKVPNVVDLSANEALIDLQGDGLRARAVAGCDQLVDQGTVYVQSPAAGTKVRAGSIVTFVYEDSTTCSGP